MEKTMDSAVKLVVEDDSKVVPEAKKVFDFEEFNDWEEPEAFEEPSAITEILHKFWEKCSPRLIDALLVVTAVLLIATMILENQIMGVITLVIAVLAMASAFGSIVKDSVKAAN